jgi:hypothetical protein
MALLFVAAALAFLYDARGSGTTLLRAALVEPACAAE